MISRALVEQIEDHSARLAQEVMAAIRNDIRTKSYHQLPEPALRKAVEELFRHLGRWLSSRTDYSVERHYQKIGRERYLQGIDLSEVLYAFSVVRTTLIRFLRGSAIGEPEEVHAEYELALSICDFTEKAVYYVARGYEDACLADAKATTRRTAKGKIETQAKANPTTLPQEPWDPAEEWNPDISRGGDVGEVSG